MQDWKPEEVNIFYGRQTHGESELEIYVFISEKLEITITHEEYTGTNPPVFLSESVTIRRIVEAPHQVLLPTPEAACEHYKNDYDFEEKKPEEISKAIVDLANMMKGLRERGNFLKCPCCSRIFYNKQDLDDHEYAMAFRQSGF